jgi:outer membrane protein assembly factor BamB
MVVGAATATMKWFYSTGLFNSPSVSIGSDGTVYSAANNLVALHSDGTEKWIDKSVLGFGSAPTIAADGTIYFTVEYFVGNTNTLAYALRAENPDGTAKWTLGSDTGPTYGLPTIGADGTLYAVGPSNGVYALNPDLSQKWVYFANADDQLTGPSVAPDGSVAFGTGYDGTFYDLHPDGTFNWHSNNGDLDPVISPLLDPNGNVFASSGAHAVAFRPDGSLKWDYQTMGGITGVAFGVSSDIYVVSLDHHLYRLIAYGTQASTQLWSFDTGQLITSGVAVDVEGTAYFGAWDNNIYAVRADGSLKWKFQTTAHIESGIAIGGDGTIYAGTDDGVIWAIGP